MKSDFDVVVIGCGVAGMTAAMYLKRDNMNVALIEKGSPGGLINISSTIENYPGFTKITGPELAFKMYEQILSLNIPIKTGNVLRIDNAHDDIKTIVTDKEEITCRKIILAVGREPKKLNIDSFDQLTGRGISYCALCDGALYKGKDVAVVGSGNSALEETLYLSNLCNKVYLLLRKDDFSGDEILVEKIKKKDNIEVLFNANIKEFNKNNEVLESININQKKEVIQLAVAAVFIFIGYQPATSFLKDMELLDNQGYIICNEERRTKIDGIYAAGDVVNKSAFQIITASADGAIAAVSCVKDFEK